MNLVDKVFRARIGIEDEGTLSVTGNTTLSSNVTISQGIVANGSIGNASDVLTSNGTGVYWASSNTKPDAAYSNAVAYASNATNLTTGTIPNARLGANVVNTSAAFTITGVHTYNANVVVANGTANGILFANTTNAYFTGIALNANDSVTVGSNTASTLRTYSETQAGNAYSNAVSVAASDATSKAATAYSNAVANSANATNLTSGTVASGRLSGSYTGITAIGAQATANITQINLDSSGLNYIKYEGSNNFSVYAGGVKVLEGNSTVVLIESNNVILDNTTANIKVGYTITPYNLGTVTSGTVTPAPANGNYQYYTNNGAHTLAAPAADCAIDVLITNGSTAGAITFSGFTVGSTVGDALTTTNTNKFLISIRRINSISTYVIKALQ